MIIGGITYDVSLYISSAWVSLEADPQAIEITRGRDDDLATTQAGKCTLRLMDTTGKYAAENPASPLYPYLRPRVPVRVVATYDGDDYGVFYGFLERCESAPDFGSQQATLEAMDLFTRLAVVRPVVASTGATTTGAAIGALLDWLGWTDPAMRDLDTGDTIPDFAADGSTSGLALIAALLEAERGQFSVNGSGVAVYENRHARSQGARSSSQATIDGTMAAVAPATDIATIYNVATVTATGGTPQTATDAASAAKFDPRPFGDIATPYLATDSQAAGLAAYMVSLRKDPIPTARRLRLVSDVEAARVPLLARDLGDRITATSTLTGIAGDYHIESVRHAVDTDSMRATVDWTLSKRRAISPFLIGRSGLGDTSVGLSY